MLKTRLSRDRFIFSMGIPYLGKTVFMFRRGPGGLDHSEKAGNRLNLNTTAIRIGRTYPKTGISSMLWMSNPPNLTSMQLSRLIFEISESLLSVHWLKIIGWLSTFLDLNEFCARGVDFAVRLFSDCEIEICLNQFCAVPRYQVLDTAPKPDGRWFAGVPIGQLKTWSFFNWFMRNPESLAHYGVVARYDILELGEY